MSQSSLFSWSTKALRPWFPLLLLIAAGGLWVLAPSWSDSSETWWQGLFLRVRTTLVPTQETPSTVVTVVWKKDAPTPAERRALLERLRSWGVRTVLWTAVATQEPITLFGSVPSFPGGLVVPSVNPHPGLVTTGFWTVQPDDDGHVRRLKVFENHRDGLAPSASLRALLSYLHVPAETLQHPVNGNLILRGASGPGGGTFDLSLPVDEQGRVTLSWKGRSWHDIQYYPAERLLALPPSGSRSLEAFSELSGTLVLVHEGESNRLTGRTLLAEMPLVELHRIFLEEALTKTLVRPAGLGGWLVWLAMGVILITAGLTARSLVSHAMFMTLAATTTLAAGFSLSLIHESFDPGAPLAAVFAGFFLVAGLAWADERRLLREYRDQFTRERYLAMLGKQTTFLTHNLKGLCELALGITQKIPETPDEARPAYMKIQTDALMMMRDHLNGASGLLQGEGWMKGTAVNLSAMTQGLWNLYTGTTPGSDQWVLTLPDRPAMGLVPPLEYLQVVDNLLKNAIEAVPVDQAIRLTLLLEPGPNGYALTLEDNGPGFPGCLSCRANCLTCPRIRPGRTTKPDGRGLGLVYIIETLKRWGSSLSIGRSGDQGARFHITSIPGR